MDTARSERAKAGHTRRALAVHGLEVKEIGQGEMMGEGYYGDDWSPIPGPEPGGFAGMDHYRIWRYELGYRGTAKYQAYRKTLVRGRPTGKGKK